MSKPNHVFFAACKVRGIPEPVTEHRFHAVRKWRFDYAWPQYRVALEVDGGIFTGGKHGRGAGIAKDHEKANYAAAMGWLLIRVQPKHLNLEVTAQFIKAAIAANTPRVQSNPNPPQHP
jgi:very-short-patch-repair endonuclease